MLSVTRTWAWDSPAVGEAAEADGGCGGGRLLADGSMGCSRTIFPMGYRRGLGTLPSLPHIDAQSTTTDHSPHRDRRKNGDALLG